jgi:hypothetical protein
MTYKANVIVPEEIGNLSGTLKIAEEGYTLKVNGKIGPVDLGTIEINGHWTLIERAKGHGVFSATLVFDNQGEFISGEIELTGKWQP